MHQEPDTKSTVLLVGSLDSVAQRLCDRGIAVSRVRETTTAIERVAGGGLDCVVAAYQTAPLTGVELASAVQSRADVPTVVVGDAPDGAADVPGVHRVVADAGPREVADAVVRAIGPRTDGPDPESAALTRSLDVYETILGTAADGIYLLDADGRVKTVNDALLTKTGYDRETLLDEHVSVLISEEDVARGKRRIAEELRTPEPGVISLPVTLERADGTTCPAECRIGLLTEDGTLRGTVGVCRDRSDQRSHEETLTELHDSSRALLAAESSHEVSDAVVEAAETILDIEVASVYRFDEAANALRPQTWSEQTAALLGDPPTFRAGEGIAWEVFVSGDSRMYDDVSQAPGAYNPQTPIRAEVCVPIGDHGVMLFGSTTAGEYDGRTVELAEILAANAEAAYDRMERDARLHERDRELREQNRRLTQLEEINDRVRQIAHELVGATTRYDIERIVCDRLASLEDHEFVWIGETDAVGSAVTPRFRAGTKRGYLDAVTIDAEATVPEPTARAAQTQGPVVTQVSDELRDGRWQQEALTRDYRSVASFPLRHGGVPYGTLSVYASRVDAFEGETEAVLTELARTVGHAIATVTQRRALLADTQAELVFGIEQQATVLFTLADTLDCELSVTRLLPQSDRTSLAFGTATGVSEAAFRTGCEDSHGVERVRVLQADGDEIRFELRVDGPSVVDPVGDHGGSFQRLVIDDGAGLLELTVPAAGDVSAFVNTFVERFPGTELLARRETDHREEPIQRALDSLTERQREVLEVAHRHGYYEWPRDSTGEDVAESLDISVPTLTEHLRRAEAKLVAAVVSPVDSPTAR
jgi:PAS domain S-box-containing protein